MREKTEAEYKRTIERYKNFDLEKPRVVYNELRKSGLQLGYIKNVICAFKWKTKNDEYGKIIKELIDEIKITKKKHTNKFEKIDWAKIVEPAGDTVDDLIKGLYTLFPPRRVIDYAYMVLVDNNTGVTNNNYNYYVVSTNKFVFQNYKTVGKYKVQKFEVSEKLKKLIERYVKKQKIGNGDALLKFRKGSNVFSEQSLMKRIKKIFGTSVDGLRHSYITYIYKDGQNLYDIEDISLKMAHDIRTHLTYLDKENPY